MLNTINKHESHIDILIQLRQEMKQLMKEAVVSIKDWNGSSIDLIND